jgi:4-aminobutyrate aminotransferase
VEEIAEVRGKGLMLGVELVERGTLTPSPALASRILEEARKEALLIGKGGLHGNVLRLAPPMTLTAEEATEGFEKLETAVRRVTET